MTRKKQVRTVIFDTVKKQKGLSLGIVSAVIRQLLCSRSSRR